ncbi:MAG: methyltransferase domain-containing protein [Candidatus Micrarchaeota archaeon]
MRKYLLTILRCTGCKGALKLQKFEGNADGVSEGKLTCKSCSAEYPVINHTPRMLPSSMMDELVWEKYPEFVRKYGKRFKKFAGKSADSEFEKSAKTRTSKSFGFEWNEFSEMHGAYRKQFLDWMAPFKPELFENKVVLDAGCGMGRHLLVASEYAKEIVGIDLSEAVDASQLNLGKRKNVHLVQADIYNLPFERVFDVVYSIGVIHHLPHPERGFRKLLKHIRKGGKIFVWIYGHEGNFVMVNFIEPFRKYFTSKLPHKVLYYLSYPITALLELSCVFYRIANAIPLINSLAPHLPSFKYLIYISNFSFRHKLAIVFDFLSAPLARYYKKAQFERWFANAGLSPKIYHHNDNSWKGLATIS